MIWLSFLKLKSQGFDLIFEFFNIALECLLLKAFSKFNIRNISFSFSYFSFQLVDNLLILLDLFSLILLCIF